MSSLTLSGSYSLTIRYTACLLSLAGLLSSILSLSLRLAACLFSHYQASAYLFSYQQTHRLPIFTLSDSLPSILTRRLAVYLSSHSHLGSLSVYSHTIRLLPICSHTIWLSILTLSDSLPSILTPSGSLPIYSHTIRIAVIYSHTIRLTLYLFSHSSYCLSVFTPNAIKVFLLSSSPMYSCTLGLTAYVFSYSN